MTSEQKPVVLYDADCGFCRWSVKLVQRWDRAGRLRAMPIQSAEGTCLLQSVPSGIRLDSVHLVLPDGRIRSAGAAIPPLLGYLPGATVAARLTERFPGSTEYAYRQISSRRTTLGRILRRLGRIPPKQDGPPP